MADPLLGVMVGHYRVEGVVGRGGMGVVYRAIDVRLGRAVALKLVADHLAADDTFVRRFLAEGQAAAALEHPNVVPVYDVGEHDGRPWLAMRMVDGKNLGELLAAGPLEPQRALRLIGQVADALDAMHAQGQVHRDVKPANVMVGAGDHAMLSDFGLARAIEGTRFTQTGGFAASPAYASPEQLQAGDVGPAGDQYALTGVLFTCLSGQEPFPRPDLLAVMMAHATSPPPRVTDVLPDVPSAVDSAIARGMAKEPADRFGSCRDMVEAAGSALLHAASAPTIVGTAVPAAPRPQQPDTLIVPAPPAPPTAPLPPPRRAGYPPGPSPRPRRSWRRWHTVLGIVGVLSTIGAIAAVTIAGRDSRGNGETDLTYSPKANVDHWHTAYGVYICNRWLVPVEDEADPLGIHSHADGIIHVHPVSESSAGINATFGRFVEAIGASVSDTQISWSPGSGATTETYKEGQSCKGLPAKITGFSDGEEHIGDPSNILLNDRGKIVIAFVPEGTGYAAIGDPPSTPGLDTLTDIDPAGP